MVCGTGNRIRARGGLVIVVVLGLVLGAGAPAGAQPSTCASGMGFQVADGGVGYETIASTTAGPITAIWIAIDLEHGSSDDLEVVLTHETSGTTVELFSSIGGSAGSFSGGNLFYLDDRSGAVIGAVMPPPHGSVWSPERIPALQKFYGLTGASDWTLEFFDLFQGSGCSGVCPPAIVHGWSVCFDTYSSPAILFSTSTLVPRIVDDDELGVAMAPFDARAFIGDCTLDDLLVDALGTGDDSVAVADVRLFHDLDDTGTVTAGDTELGAAGASFPVDDGQLVVQLASPLVIQAGTSIDLLLVYDFNGAGSGGETFRARISQATISNPAGAAALGLPVSGAEVELLSPPWGFTHTANTTTSITWAWNEDNASETGFEVHDTTESIRGAVAADVTSWVETGLSENGRYTRHAHAIAAGAAYFSRVRINEIDIRSSDEVEFYNASDQPVNLSGWKIWIDENTEEYSCGGGSCTPQNPISYTFPQGYVLPVGGFTVLHQGIGAEDQLNRYLGRNIPWDPAQTGACSLVTSSGEIVDYVEWLGNDPASCRYGCMGNSNIREDPTYAATQHAWAGTITPSNDDLMYRNWDIDTDDASDWTRLPSGVGTYNPPMLNPGQYGGGAPLHTSAPSAPHSAYAGVHDATVFDFQLVVASATRIDVIVTLPPNSTAGLTGVQIERCTGGGCSVYSTVATFSQSYVHADTTVLPSTTYCYRVRFRNGDGDLAGWSPRLCAATPGGTGACALGGQTCGDCDLSGSVDILDAHRAALHSAGLVDLGGAAFSACNVEGDMEPGPHARVGTLDALTLARFVVGLDSISCCMP